MKKIHMIELDNKKLNCGWCFYGFTCTVILGSALVLT